MRSIRSAHVAKVNYGRIYALFLSREFVFSHCKRVPSTYAEIESTEAKNGRRQADTEH